MWKPKYAATRRAKYQSDAGERERRKEQGRTPEENRLYMADYYNQNKHRWDRLPEQKDNRNEQRRNRYASDQEHRELVKAAARSYGVSKKRKERRRSKFLESIGLTEAIYQKMFVAQDGRCAICTEQSKGRLRPDHCHKRGIARGLLCDRCNLALGLFKDCVESLQRAVVYLGRY